MHSRNDFTPQLGNLEHVGLIYGRDFFTTLQRGLEGDMCDSLDLRCCINLGIDAALTTIGECCDTFGLTEIDAASEFPDYQQVGALNHLFLERRCGCQ